MPVAAGVFPLVPRHRVHGLELGPLRGARRGPGSDTAGSRPYRPGDDVRTIDWGASARLSAALGGDEFVVRERYAELAARVVLVADRRPAMALYPEPWLSKSGVVAEVEELVAQSTFAGRGLVGEVVLGASGAEWRPPAATPLRWLERGRTVACSAPNDCLASGLEHLLGQRGLVAGTFVFVVSDFLAPVPEELWVEALARGLDVVPVVVQDPTWEASFPEEVGGLVLPVADPETGRLLPVRLSRREARERRFANEARHAAVHRRFAELGLDPIAIGGRGRDVVLAAFSRWAQARLLPVGRVA